ncbi:MAG: extracellular solute-binding protein [Alphaproteobacteria bacterium]|nr:extracellular solute-binding protein [Alphaproteobacteria bacterium]
MTEKISRRQVVAGAAGLALAAPAVHAQQQVTITFRFNDPEAPQMRGALDEFERRNPDIKVTMQRVSWGDAQQQYLREAAVGSAPDVAQLAFVWPRAFGGARSLRPLDDYIQRDGARLGAGGWDGFFARDLAVGADNKVYAIPWTTDTFAMMYNKDLFAQAGITSFPTDWEALRAASQTIQQRTGKPGWAFPAGSCGTPAIWFFMNFYWWSKGPGLIDRGSDGRFLVSMTPQQIQEGFDYYNRYLQEGHNPRASLSICLWGAPEVVEGMLSGNIAMCSNPDTVAIEILDKWAQRNPGRPAPFATAPHPAGPNGSRTFFGGRMLGISPNSRFPEQAWKLIQYLVTPDPTFARFYTNYTPAQQAAITARAWAPEMSGYPAQLRTARSWGPYGTGPVAIPFMWNAVGRAAGSVFIGEKTAAQASQELHDAISRELARNQR